MAITNALALPGMLFKPMGHHCLKASIFWKSMTMEKFNALLDFLAL